MDSLTPDVRKFLEEEMKLDSNQFLASQTSEIASRYEQWREVNGKPTLRHDARSAVYAWKQEVTKRLRSNEGKTSGSGPSRIITLPMAALRKQEKIAPTSSSESSPQPKIKRFDMGEIPGYEGHTKDPFSDYSNSNVSMEIIYEPRENDVLSGRGGLTNQHPGNEWYRRLVRCSRGFYRSCPKHTKLLVAKAIVRAVHSQVPPGRFLELPDKNSNFWKEVDYKKSVEKSSQALRERWEANDDDDVLQRSMTVMFNKKLRVNSAGRASKPSVEEAVYFAVMSVALEYARRWGTKGVATLTEQLRPIVKSTGITAIPRPNGPVLPSKTKQTASTPASAAVKSAAAPAAVTKKPAPSKKVVQTPSVDRNSSIARPPGEAGKSAYVPGPTVTSPIPTTPATITTANHFPHLMAVEQTVHQQFHQAFHQQQMFQAAQFHQNMNSNLPLVVNTVSPPSSLKPASSSFGTPVTFATFRPQVQQGHLTNQQLPIQGTSADVPAPIVEGFGSVVQPQLVAGSTRKDNISGELNSVSKRPGRSSLAVQNQATADGGVDTPTPANDVALPNSNSGDTFGQPVRRTVSHTPMASRNGTTQSLRPPDTTPDPLAPSENGFNLGTKRRLSNIVSKQEIEEENEKRPKNHGMSPFHREILKMNLQLLVDW
ncbi:hypothetical protein IV203_003131 [Nitzschia inconspicua]|uniref:DUF6824 domain-containing protein n=1 Tax=Nitzschia inconspicua TaxID=303405 RepID=A0A9K3L2Z2_9STRA|nr:hypothetical protein IV203_003131 [Nitzschia inconspicua]